MADAWLVISSANLDSHCGEEAGYALADALDGTDWWRHDVNEAHWFIIDLGQTYTIKKVRGRSFKAGRDPTDVDIFVSDSKVDWGNAVATSIATWRDTGEWQEVDTTDKNGRYIKVVINDTESASRSLGFGVNGDTTIFDAYGDIALIAHEWEGSDGIAIGEALVKTPMKMLVDGFQFSDVTIKEFYKVLTDPIAFTDTLVKYKTMFRTFTDGIALTDVVSKMVSKILSDGIKFTDCLTHWRWLAAIRNLVRRRCNQPSIREQNAVDDGNI